MSRLHSQPSDHGRGFGQRLSPPQNLMARGATPSSSALRLPAVRTSMLRALPHESEDIEITGGTRSLVRRLMALNVPGSLKKPQAAVRSVPEGKIA